MSTESLMAIRSFLSDLRELREKGLLHEYDCRDIVERAQKKVIASLEAPNDPSTEVKLVIKTLTEDAALYKKRLPGEYPASPKGTPSPRFDN